MTKPISLLGRIITLTAVLIMAPSACATLQKDNSPSFTPRALPPLASEAEGPFFTPLPEEFIAQPPEIGKRASSPKKRYKWPEEVIVSLKQLRKENSSAKLSLNAKNATIGDLAELISVSSGYPVIVEPDIGQKVSLPIFLQETDWINAVKTVARINGLAATLDGHKLLDDMTTGKQPNGVVSIMKFETLLARQEKLMKAGGNAVTIAEQQRKVTQEIIETKKTKSAGEIISQSYRFRYADPYEAMSYLETLFITFEKETTRSETQNISGASTSERYGNQYGGKRFTERKGAKDKNAFIRSKKSDANDVRFAVYAPENLLTIYAPTTKMAEIIRRIGEIDVPPRQVYIEARIVEIQRDSVRDLGIEWGGHSTNTTDLIFPNIINVGGGASGGGVSGAPVVSLPPSSAIDPATGQVARTPQGSAIGLTIGDVSGTRILRMRLFALEKAGLSRTLSNPKVVAINGGRASIKSGREIPYQSASANLGTSVQFKEAVIALSVTPLIMDNNRIRLKIEAKKDEVDPALSVGGVPSIKKKEIVTTVIVENGGSAVLGGVFEGEKSSFQNRVPWFHKIPFIGWMFKNDRKVNNELELLVFITPNVIKEESRQ